MYLIGLAGYSYCDNLHLFNEMRKKAESATQKALDSASSAIFEDDKQDRVGYAILEVDKHGSISLLRCNKKLQSNFGGPLADKSGIAMNLLDCLWRNESVTLRSSLVVTDREE